MAKILKSFALSHSSRCPNDDQINTRYVYVVWRWWIYYCKWDDIV